MPPPARVQGSRGKAVVSDVEVLIQGYSVHLTALQKSPKTVVEYVKDVRQWFGWWQRPPEFFKEHEWDDWMSHETQRGVTARTIVRHRVSVQRFFKYLRRLKLVDHDPGKESEPLPIVHKLPVFLTEPEVQGMKAASRNPRQRAILALLYDCGLRNEEARLLRLGDITQEYVHVKRGKRSKERFVPISAETHRAIRGWIPSRTGPTDFLLTGEMGAALSERAVIRTIKSLARGMEKRITPHVMRHSIATHLHNRGVALEDIRDFLGHESIQTTMIYVHVAKEQMRSRILAAHPSNLG